MKYLTYLILVCSISAVSCATINSFANPYYKKVPDPSVNTNYDKFEGYWKYETTENILLQSPGHSIYSTAYIICREKEKCNPKLVSLHFTSKSEDWHFLDYHRTNFLIGNDQRYEYDSNPSRSVMPDATVLEQITIQVDFQTFKKIAFSKDVSARLGIDTLNMAYSNREIYRKLLISLQ